MQNIINKLNYLNETKNMIKQAINNKGVLVTDNDTFRSYASKIESIKGASGGGGGQEQKPLYTAEIKSVVGIGKKLEIEENLKLITPVADINSVTE